MSDNSYRQILRSTAITGGASLLNLVLGLLRTKVVAVVLGPVGIGLLGFYGNLVTTIATIASFGMVNAGTREIARIGTNDIGLQLLKRTLAFSMFAAGALGAVLFIIFSDSTLGFLAHSQPSRLQAVWLGLSIFFITASGAQVAIINGIRRIDLLARITILTALTSTVAGIIGILTLGRSGIFFLILIGPLAGFICGHFYVFRLGVGRTSFITTHHYATQWRDLAKIGASFMLASLAMPAGQLVARAIIQQRLGTEALGLFHASTVVSAICTGLVLNAMAADYFPKLSSAITTPSSANKLVNEQTEVALLVLSPLLIAMIGLSPWLMDVMYSREFAASAAILRWQILGDILKVAAWPIGFVLLASGDIRGVLLSEFIGVVVYCLLIWLGLQFFGIQAAGLSYLGMYIVYILLVHGLARKKTSFSWTHNISRLVGTLLFIGIGVLLTAAISPIAGAVAALLSATIQSFYALHRLQSIDALPPKIALLYWKLRNIVDKR